MKIHGSFNKKVLAFLLFVIITILPSAGHSLEIVEDRLYLYGYFDATPGYNRYDSGTWGMDAYHWVTIFSWKISDKIRFVGDLTFEHGPYHKGKSGVGDIKARSFVQLKYNDALEVNVGKFLTPFGVYNVIHDATPTYLSVTSPRSLYWSRKIGENESGADVKDRLFSKEAAGIWFYGIVNLTDVWSIEYHQYIVNGHSGPSNNEYQTDDNNNKGLGGKIVLLANNNFRLGSSYYIERNGNLDGDAQILTYALEGAYSKGPFSLSGEYMKSNIEAHSDLSEANPVAYYSQLSYAIIEALTPYLRYDSYENNTYNEDERITTIGLNYMLHPQTYLKGEYGFYKSMEDVVQFQITVAY